MPRIYCTYNLRGCLFSSSTNTVIKSHEQSCHYKRSYKKRTSTSNIATDASNAASSTKTRDNFTKQSILRPVAGPSTRPLEAYTTSASSPSPSSSPRDQPKPARRGRKRSARSSSPSPPREPKHKYLRPELTIINQDNNRVMYHVYPAMLTAPDTRNISTQTDLPNTPEKSTPPAPCTSTPVKPPIWRFFEQCAATDPSMKELLDRFHKTADPTYTPSKLDPKLPVPQTYQSANPLHLDGMPQLELNSFETECADPNALPSITDEKAQ